jgi:hypothetical protein
MDTIQQSGNCDIEERSDAPGGLATFSGTHVHAMKV